MSREQINVRAPSVKRIVFLRLLYISLSHLAFFFSSSGRFSKKRPLKSDIVSVNNERSNGMPQSYGGTRDIICKSFLIALLVLRNIFSQAGEKLSYRSRKCSCDDQLLGFMLSLPTSIFTRPLLNAISRHTVHKHKQ